MDVIPAIDIRGGRYVRLHQGDYERETVFGDDPRDPARRWQNAGASRIHIVDLDGARDGRPANLEAVRAIVEAVDCQVQVGGGVRSMETLETWLEAGVGRVVLGTAAVKDPEFLARAVARAEDALIVSVDAREGLVNVEGWTESTQIRAEAFIARLAELGVTRIVYTDILRDGASSGPNVEMYRAITARSPLAVIAAGGVGSVEDVRRLAAAGVEGAIIGRALYDGSCDLAEAIAAADAS